MKKFSSKTQKTGEIGENLACKFLVKHGFSVLERNYTKKWGEIDIIAKKKGVLRFVEVKAGVTHETLSKVTRVTMAGIPQGKTQSVTHETIGHVTRETFRPEENLHPQKLKRLFRAIETYLAQNKLQDKPWQVDLAIVSLNLENKEGRVRMLENIII